MVDSSSNYKWLNEYERTWETIKERSGQFSMETTERVQLFKKIVNKKLSLMRHIMIIIDCSEHSLDPILKPNCLQFICKILGLFFEGFFEKNPLSQLGLVISKNCCSQIICNLTSSSSLLKKSLDKISATQCFGNVSLDTIIEISINSLKLSPLHVNREMLFLTSSINIANSLSPDQMIEKLNNNKINLSIISSKAELFINKKLAQSTNGLHAVAIDEQHMKELIMEFVRPLDSNNNQNDCFIRVGFPSELINNSIPCFCHKYSIEKIKKGYVCPQCGCKVCELPIECPICGLLLVLAPHISRTNMLLFPLTSINLSKTQCNFECSACDQLVSGEELQRFECNICNSLYCFQCQHFMNDNLDYCPNCPLK